MNKKEEKQREWKDKNEDLKYVCQGAQVQCKYCNPPIAPLIITAESFMLQDKPWATDGDKDGKKNFGFMGVCMHPSQQKMFSPPPPCKSVISLGGWKDYSQTMVGSHHALLQKSKIPCMISGEDIQIIYSGQTATLTQINPLEFDKKILDVYWIDKSSGKKMREVQPDEEVTLYIETRGYNEGELVETKMSATDGYTFKDGSTEMPISGTVNSENLVIIENFLIQYK